MDEKNRKQIRKTERKPKNDPAVNRYSINLNAEENAKFLALFDQSGINAKAHFITACIFQKTVKTIKIDMDAIEYHAGLTKFFGQFRGIATFHIDLGDFYHTFLELKSRKINRTKFLDILKETLIRKWTNRTEDRIYLVFNWVYSRFIFSIS